jgi:two-component system nitrate/nitrite response regulator NarL
MNRATNSDRILSGPPWRLALVDPDLNLHRAVREHFAALNDGWQVETYASGAEARNGFAAALPHVMLMDILLPSDGGLHGLQTFNALWPALPVVLFTAEVRPVVLLRAMMTGATGCLIKPQPPAALLPHLRKALDGGLALCEKAERLLLEGLRGLRLEHSALGLSWAEEQVMLGLCLQRRSKDCAEALGISEGTVHVHLRSIFKKLGVHDRESAVRRFLEGTAKA